VAESFIQHHTTLWGYVHPNVSFINGNIERLNNCGINESTIDIIISNCVINLCPNKANVLRGAYDILKFGGEVYFSDVYTDKAMSLEVKSNKVLHGECIAGALVWKELMDMAVKIGFAPPVLVDVAPLNVNNHELMEILGDNKFCSATYRLFKLEVNATTPAAPSSVIIQYKGHHSC
jgi:arsenite methyltransferase